MFHKHFGQYLRTWLARDLARWSYNPADATWVGLIDLLRSLEGGWSAEHSLLTVPAVTPADAS